MVEAVGKAGLLYICNPNNPTGTITPKADVRNAIGAVPNDVTIVVDEAYHHYVVSDDYESVIPTDPSATRGPPPGWPGFLPGGGRSHPPR